MFNLSFILYAIIYFYFFLTTLYCSLFPAVFILPLHQALMFLFSLLQLHLECSSLKVKYSIVYIHLQLFQLGYSCLSNKTACPFIFFSFFMLLIPSPVPAHRKYSVKLCNTIFISFSQWSLPPFCFWEEPYLALSTAAKKNKGAIDRIQGVTETETS